VKAINILYCLTFAAGTYRQIHGARFPDTDPLNKEDLKEVGKKNKQKDV